MNNTMKVYQSQCHPYKVSQWYILILIGIELRLTMWQVSLDLGAVVIVW